MPTESVMLTISFSTTFFSFCLQSFPASRPFEMSQFFASGGQSIGASAITNKLDIFDISTMSELEVTKLYLTT